MKKSLFISQNILQCSSFPTRQIFWDMSCFNMLPFTIVSLVSIVSFTIKEERIFNKTKLNGYKEMSEWFYKSVGGKPGRIHMKSRWQQIKILALNQVANCERIAFQIACVNKNFKSQFEIKGWETVFLQNTERQHKKSSKETWWGVQDCWAVKLPLHFMPFSSLFSILETLFSGRVFYPFFPILPPFLH